METFHIFHLRIKDFHDCTFFSSVQLLSRVQLFATPWMQHTRPPCPSPTPRVHSDSRPLSPWCLPAISSLVIPFSSCLQSLPASKPFPMSQLFTWDGQSTGVSASASLPPKKSQGWSPSEWIGWISLQSKGLSRVFSNTTVQKHQLSSWCCLIIFYYFIIFIPFITYILICNHLFIYCLHTYCLPKGSFKLQKCKSISVLTFLMFTVSYET